MALSCLLLLSTAARTQETTDTQDVFKFEPSNLNRELEGQNDFVKGKSLAAAYCSACHLFPQPELLDKKTWKEGALDWMRIFLGFSPERVNLSQEADLLKATGLFPDAPVMPVEHFDLIEDYYLSAAPRKTPPQAARPPIEVSAEHFTVSPVNYRRDVPMSTLIQISRKGDRVYLGDAQTGALDVITPEGRRLQSIQVDNMPIALHESANGVFLTSIGRFYPSEDPRGDMRFLKWDNGLLKPDGMLFDKLPRPTHASFADLNGDGREDIVLCLYGNFVGRFSWFERLESGQYREHTLLPKPGALRSEIRDLNDDGHLDIAVLVAQSTESLSFFYGDGKGGFEEQVLFQKHPVFGHSYFELVDFNRDGLLDVLTTNGDNGEYDSPLKNYHGIRLYLNQGGNALKEAWFYPLNGAFKAMARDYDEDGDLDIAAISYFPDYQNSPKESFVYLENRGALDFKATTIRKCIAGRWLTMDAGDLDGDGDIDLILGSVVNGPSKSAPDWLQQTWEKQGPAFLILKNNLRN